MGRGKRSKREMREYEKQRAKRRWGVRGLAEGALRKTKRKKQTGGRCGGGRGQRGGEERRGEGMCSLEVGGKREGFEQA